MTEFRMPSAADAILRCPKRRIEACPGELATRLWS
jgi:hypothetical protein